MSDDARCENCVWFAFTVGVPNAGQCHRYPPTAVATEHGVVVSARASVRSEEVCGEHKHKDPAKRPAPDTNELIDILGQIVDGYRALGPKSEDER